MRRFQLASNLPRAISERSYASEISPPLERIVIDSCPRAFRHTGVSSPMSAAMTAASAVASATAGRAAGRPRANAKVRLRPVPPRTHLRRAIRVARTFCYPARDVWRRRARGASPHRPTAAPPRFATGAIARRPSMRAKNRLFRSFRASSERVRPRDRGALRARPGPPLVGRPRPSAFAAASREPGPR